LRILQIWAPYRERGGEEYVVDLVDTLLSKNHVIETCVFELDPLLEGPFGSLLALTSFYYNRQSLGLLQAHVERFKPDVVISHNIMPAGSYAIYQWLNSRSIPLAYYVHNFRPYSVNGYCWANGRQQTAGLARNFLPEIINASWQNSLLRTTWYAVALWYSHACGIWNSVDRWIMISDFMKQTMLKGGVHPDRAALLRHPWIESGHPTEPPLQSRQQTFLYIGRISEEKGIRVLLDAWKTVEELYPDAKLMIAGGGPLVPWLADQCKVFRHLEFHGYADEALKHTLRSNSCALIVPSVWWEPLGLVVYEAYEYGLPVLAANSGGLNETVTHGVSGWIHDSGDSGMLALQIVEAISNPAETIRRGGNGHLWLTTQNRTEAWVQRMETILCDCVESKSHRDLDRSLELVVYLADQNPRHDRSIGISRMSEAILAAMSERSDLNVKVITSESSQQGPKNVASKMVLPFRTRSKAMRLLADHFHGVFAGQRFRPDIWYYPKGFLPLVRTATCPSAITIHDTIIQYYRDHYPTWRKSSEYYYWARMLKHTLEKADCILTVSESSKRQIIRFMERHHIAPKAIHVTYEPCLYERVPQPTDPEKSDYVVHLASIEPHKQTARLVDWWCSSATTYCLPPLRLIGVIPREIRVKVEQSHHISLESFMNDHDLQQTLKAARALILPSEIEGFGLPAVESYYLGTPVCHVVGTSVEEILSVATEKGRFSLGDMDTLGSALQEVLAMPTDEVYRCGLRLRSEFSSEVVTEKMVSALRQIDRSSC
jgi:glycosyltransferase involved in cell wall biosynthesis